MSSDEDFSVVVNDDTETMEGIRDQISKLKEQHDLLIQEQQDLDKDTNVVKDLEERFKKRIDPLKQALEEDAASHTEMVGNGKEKLASLRNEEVTLRKEIVTAQEQYKQLEENIYQLRQQTAVRTAVPEKKVVFTGMTDKDANTQSYQMKSRVEYPMEGGTAFITFEKEEVARKILDMRRHKVELGDCSITLEAKPFFLMVPRVMEMDTQICPSRVLVSNLPGKLSVEVLKDKLEIHFSKSKNGGGEVEDTELLEDSGNVVIKFVRDKVAKCLTDTLYHDVDFGSKKYHNVKVTPFLNGNITHFQPRESVCSHTVLLTGIPDVMDQDNLQDLLEIHFQKSSHGGGEVEAILYNPVGQRNLALFQEDCPPQV